MFETDLQRNLHVMQSKQQDDERFKREVLSLMRCIFG